MRTLAVVPATVAVLAAGGPAAGAGSPAQPSAPVAAKAEVCFACHGPGGNSPAPDIPSIAGQPALYTFFALQAIRDGRRASPVMAPVVKGLTDADLQALAAFFAEQRPQPPLFAVSPERVAAGRAKVDASRCAGCHGARFEGQDQIPRLAGQPPAYLARQMRAFRGGTRADEDGTMTSLMRPLSDAEIEGLADYLASLR
jgi:cytochrome c553